jgi:hypothetical protein
MNNLELTGMLTHQDILVQSFNTLERTFSLLNDNSPTISCATKGSITSRLLSGK